MPGLDEGCWISSVMNIYWERRFDRDNLSAYFGIVVWVLLVVAESA